MASFSLFASFWPPHSNASLSGESPRVVVVLRVIWVCSWRFWTLPYSSSPHLNDGVSSDARWLSEVPLVLLGVFKRFRSLFLDSVSSLLFLAFPSMLLMMSPSPEESPPFCFPLARAPNGIPANINTTATRITIPASWHANPTKATIGSQYCPDYFLFASLRLVNVPVISKDPLLTISIIRQLL